MHTTTTHSGRTGRTKWNEANPIAILIVIGWKVLLFWLSIETCWFHRTFVYARRLCMFNIFSILSNFERNSYKKHAYKVPAIFSNNSYSQWSLMFISFCWLMIQFYSSLTLSVPVIWFFAHLYTIFLQLRPLNVKESTILSVFETSLNVKESTILSVFKTSRSLTRSSHNCMPEDAKKLRK